MALSTTSLFISSCSPFLFSQQPCLSFSSISKLHISTYTSHLSLFCPPIKFLPPFHIVSSALQEISLQEDDSEHEISFRENTRKLYVVNLPWSLSPSDIETLFSQCGVVKDVDVIKQKNGKSRGFAFVTMESSEEAQAAIDKYNLSEVQGRTIRVEFAKDMKKPPPPPPPPENTEVKETGNKLYVSNLAWKVRSSHLREFFATSYNPLSARVVFDSPSGRSAGYGFVSFATKEEAEAAISALDGKELMGRPIRLKISERKLDGSSNET